MTPLSLPELRGELLTDVSSWTVLLCYLDTAAWLGVPPAPGPPGTDFGRLAATALAASREGLPDRREVRAAVMLNEAKHWLADTSAGAANINNHTSRIHEHGPALLRAATVYTRALCPPADQPAALDLLDPTPLETTLETARARWRQRHPFRARRLAHRHNHLVGLPHVLDPAHWQESLWWQRAARLGGTAPLVHSAAAITTAVWAWPNAVRDPIGIRQELRNRIVRGRAWAASGDLGT